MNQINIVHLLVGAIKSARAASDQTARITNSRRMAGVMSVCLAASFISLAVLVTGNAKPAVAAVTCTGVQVNPGDDLTAVTSSNPAGTTFCIQDGTYPVSNPVDAKDNDKFIGVYSDGSRPSVTTNKAEEVFDASGHDGVVIRGLEISGAVGGNYCEPGCGQGIHGGTNLTVDNVQATGNRNDGIGGTGPGLLVSYSEIDHNGSYSFTNLDGGVSQSAGIKSSIGPVTVTNSRIHDNYWVGLWCDRDCDSFTVKNSTITGNGKAGIHDEVSDGPAVFSGNTIKGNGTLAAADRHAGLLIMSSANVKAYNNTFGDNALHNGVMVTEDARLPILSNVSIYNNTMNGDALTGCELAGVTCVVNDR